MNVYIQGQLEKKNCLVTQNLFCNWIVKKATTESDVKFEIWGHTCVPLLL